MSQIIIQILNICYISQEVNSSNDLEKRILLAYQYKWKGGESACYEIQDKKGAVLFCLWSQFHAITFLILCKRIQKLSSQNPSIEK